MNSLPGSHVEVEGMSIVIGLDLGTSKICALAYDTNRKRCLALRSAANSADVCDLPASRHEQSPQKIYEMVVALLRDLVADRAVAANQVAGIGISGQMHGVMLVDENIAPITNFITWRDQRAVAEGARGSLAEARERCQAVAQAPTGCDLHAGYGAVTLFWLAANQGLPAGARAFSLADYIAAKLTGCAATEPTHAASWGILDIVKNDWQWERVERLNLPKEILPRLAASCIPMGEILPEVARAIGLPPTSRVCAPIGDNQASYFGAAGLQADAAVINLGTGGQISVPSRVYQKIAGMETRPLPMRGYLLVGASLCAGWAYAYLCRFFQQVCAEMAGVRLSAADVYSLMQALAEKIAPGAEGLEVDTRFLGTRGDPLVRGCISGMDHRNFTPAHMARAFLEGIVRELASLVEKSVGLEMPKLVASGNAVRKNLLLRQIIAEVFHIPCEVAAEAEEAALGAALAAASGLGLL